jgi:hypothetical protein
MEDEKERIKCMEEETIRQEQKAKFCENGTLFYL